MVRRAKLYADRDWLWWAYHEEKYTPEKIAQIAGTSVATVYRYLKQFKLV